MEIFMEEWSIFVGFYSAIAIPYILWKKGLIHANTNQYIFIILGFYFGVSGLFFNGWMFDLGSEFLGYTLVSFYITSSLTWFLWGDYVQDEDPFFFWIVGPLFGLIALMGPFKYLLSLF